MSGLLGEPPKYQLGGLLADPAQWQPNAHDLRTGGQRKGKGWLGVLKRPDGSISTELSIGVNIDGKEVEIPAIVPTLSPDEVGALLSMPPDARMPETVIKKAYEHARMRMRQGLSPFAD